MHTEQPPKNTLNKWLIEYPDVEGNYGHTLLEQKPDLDLDLVSELRPYFESAHLDAREHFHAIMQIDLHPDATAPGANATYPNCLPKIAQHGLFGEVLAGLITECYEFVGKHDWSIPIFLFRYHAAAETYLYDLARDPEKTKQIFGRYGSDFLALNIASDGSVNRFISGEAKWRNSLTQSVANTMLLGAKIEDPNGGEEKIHSGKGIWNEFNNDTQRPHGLSQLNRLLKDIAPAEYAETILSLDRILALENPDNVERTDLVLLAGNGGKTREAKSTLVAWEHKPEEYTAGNDLQVIELILMDGDKLVDQLYAELWQKGAEDGTT